MTPHHLETNVITNKASNQETLASPFNNTHQQTKQRQIVMHSFKINRPNHVIGYTNNPIVRQQSNNNMPYYRTASAGLMKIPVKRKTKIKVRLRSRTT